MFKRIKGSYNTIVTNDLKNKSILVGIYFNSQRGTGTHFGPACISSGILAYQKGINYKLKIFDYIDGYNLEKCVRRFTPSSDYFNFIFNRFCYRYGKSRKIQEKNFELEKIKIIDHIGMPCLYYESQSMQEIVFLEDGYVLDVRPNDIQIATDFKMQGILKVGD